VAGTINIQSGIPRHSKVAGTIKNKPKQ